jgi:NADH-quinone oxidoreductase subunit C
MADEDANDTEQPAEPDTAREELIDGLRAALGDILLEDEVVPHRDVWVRVDRAQWQTAGRIVRDLGFTYFGFLSLIDWMDAPEGRYEDTEFDDEPPPPVASVPTGDDDADEAEEEAAAAEAGAADGSEEDGAAAAPPSGGAGLRPVAGSTSRFQVIARLQKPGTALGVHLKTDLPEDDLSLDTWVDLFRGANWHEREAWEMFGVDFVGHPALRHIYLPTEFEGNPLRKDYPLLARVVKPWPGVVDIEEIPAGLEEQLEAEVMAAFEAEQAGGGGS